MKFKKTTLPNGLRVITVPVKESPAVMVMVAVETGSNYENKPENGLSHFLEHMCFKGTVRRPSSSSIALELDGLGAENNAFTANEFTTYWARAAKKHLPNLIDIVSDLYLNPTLPDKDIEIERGVILQEISMYKDLPQIKVGWVLDRLLYGDTSAGKPIIGLPENIKKFTRKNFVNYRDKHYVAGKTIVVVAGDINERRVLETIRKSFKGITSGKRVGKKPMRPRQSRPAMLIERKKTNQAHMVLALHAFPAKDRRIPALEVLSEILGQGMSSRLFRRLRDEMGACYYVRAHVDQYTDHGIFAISTGISSSRTLEVLRALIEECRKITEIPVSGEELAKAKEHSIGHLYLGLETTDSLGRFYGEQEIVYGKLDNPQELERKIRKVTSKDVMKVAKDIFRDDRLNLAIVGGIANQKTIKKALTFKK